MTRMTSDVELVRNFVGTRHPDDDFGFVDDLWNPGHYVHHELETCFAGFPGDPVDFGFFGFFISRIMPISKEVQQKLGGLNTVLQENLAGMRVVKAFAREDYERDRYLVQNEDLLDSNINMVKLFSSAFPMIFFIANLGMVAVIWFGGFQVIDLKLSLGELVAFTGYLGILLMPIFQLGMIGAMLSGRKFPQNASSRWQMPNRKWQTNQMPSLCPH